ncbi:MAG TPA: hypothetical protein VIM73_14770, partial [Polyangiaceae bacterium]
MIPRLRGALGIALLCSCAPPVRPAPPEARDFTAFSRLPVERIIVEKWPMPAPPVPTPRENVVDRYHGVDVSDPYRWLEDATDPRVSSWMDAQRSVLDRTLSGSKEREKIRARLEELLQIGSISLPALRKTREGGTRLFFTRREGAQEQPVLYVRDGVRGRDVPLVDPNALASDGTVALDWYDPSEDGSLLAYGTSQGGSEDSVLRIRDVKTGKDLPDVLLHTRHASIAWVPDGTRFFYSRYPAPGTVPAGEERYHRRIYEHRLGRDPKDDPLVFGAELPPTDYPGCQVSPDGRWLIVSISRGWDETELRLADLEQPTLEFRRITPAGKNRYFAIARGDALYVLTNEGAPRYRVFRVDPRQLERERWRLILDEHPTDVIGNLELVGSELLVSYQSAGISRLERFDVEGRSRGAVGLPTLGTSDGFSGLPDGSEAFYNFESFAVPPEIHRLDLSTGKSELWEAVQAGIPKQDFVVEQHTARSKDGTSVPYRLVRHRSVTPNSGNNPTLMHGYGG